MWNFIKKIYHRIQDKNGIKQIDPPFWTVQYLLDEGSPVQKFLLRWAVIQALEEVAGEYDPRSLDALVTELSDYVCSEERPELSKDELDAITDMIDAMITFNERNM